MKEKDIRRSNILQLHLRHASFDIMLILANLHLDYLQLSDITKSFQSTSDILFLHYLARLKVRRKASPNPLHTYPSSHQVLSAHLRPQTFHYHATTFILATFTSHLLDNCFFTCTNAILPSTNIIPGRQSRHSNYESSSICIPTQAITLLQTFQLLQPSLRPQAREVVP